MSASLVLASLVRLTQCRQPTLAAAMTVLLAVLCSSGSIAVAQTAAADKPPVSSAGTLQEDVAQTSEEQQLSAAEIQQLIDQLKAPAFAERRAATLRLREIGEPAIEPLTKLAVDPDRESAIRAMELLKHYYQEGDEAARKAAFEALEEIAASEDPRAARQAKSILNSPRPVAPSTSPSTRVRRSSVRRSVKVRIINGVKDIEVEENGRRIHIHERPGLIQIEVTEPGPGGNRPTGYSAKDLEELKEKHPRGYEIYEQYGRDPLPRTRPPRSRPR